MSVALINPRSGQHNVAPKTWHSPTEEGTYVLAGRPDTGGTPVLVRLRAHTIREVEVLSEST